MINMHSCFFRDQAWAESMKMGSFLSVTRGSEEPPRFLEIDYHGGKTEDAPVIFVGKGITFDRLEYEHKCSFYSISQAHKLSLVPHVELAYAY